ncbi:hypothetical protein QM012_001604 [Aureobasidium pullulans]|uniref:Ubiquitin-like domain-containing protein n=1 Tax=Aureobasidium pullulans TaxID=5580 RepID=A0ABR0TEL2_AURPU
MAQPTRTLSLRILSPAVELSQGLDMNDVPIDTTIAALKSRLTDLLPSNPTPDRMRLIHFGRLLANDDETLAHLFGEAAITQTTPFTLHLVVRAPPTPMETTATRQPLFANWNPQQPAAGPAQPPPNLLPPGAANHPLMRPGAAFVPQPQGATATPPHPAAPTPTIQHAHAPSPNLLHQLMERQQQQLRQLHDHRPQFPLPTMPRPTPPQSAPHTPPPFIQQHAHPHVHHHHHHPNAHAHPQPQPQHPPHQQPHQRTATITINQSTIAVPMPLGPHAMPMGQMPLPGFPPIHNLFHQHAQPQMQQFNPASPTVYLLSSPTGPQALLFSPQGTYTASLPHTPLPGIPSIANPLLAHTRPHTSAAQAPPPPGIHPAPVVIDPQQPPEQIAQQIVQQINQGGAENQEFNALAPWQPLLAQGWMLLRLLFFAWILLGTGQGWRRPLALLAIGIVFWAINAGGIGNTVRDAVRSWWEAVVGLPGQEQQQEHGVVRQALRPAERLLALLIASLWPGVGERTVTARREAEERQRREEGERQAAEAERQRQLEADQSATQAEPSSTEDSEQVTTIEGPSTTTATGNDVSGRDQEIRERKTATQDHSAEAQTASSEPTLSREEQRAQQVSNLTADW